MTAFNAEVAACYSDSGTNWLLVRAVNSTRIVGMRVEIVGALAAFQSGKTSSILVGTATILFWNSIALFCFAHFACHFIHIPSRVLH